MVAGLDSQERHHPGQWLKEMKFGGVDDGEWRELMMKREGVDGLRKRGFVPRTVDCGLRTEGGCSPPVPRRWSPQSHQGEVNLEPDCGPWDPPPPRSQEGQCWPAQQGQSPGPAQGVSLLTHPRLYPPRRGRSRSRGRGRGRSRSRSLHRLELDLRHQRGRGSCPGLRHHLDLRLGLGLDLALGLDLDLGLDLGLGLDLDLGLGLGPWPCRRPPWRWRWPCSGCRCNETGTPPPLPPLDWQVY